ncbi:MAG: type I restriction enzyme HsdR N-terminal domain-containing protein [Caldilineaceae bacterium]
MNEADTCREYVLPKLQQASWEQAAHSITEQQAITDGRIVTLGQSAKRLKRKRPDYLLRYAAHQTIAVVEAKREYKTAATGLQQAKAYAEMLELKFAYATNGHGIVEFDYLTGKQTDRNDFPTPARTKATDRHYRHPVGTTKRMSSRASIANIMSMTAMLKSLPKWSMSWAVPATGCARSVTRLRAVCQQRKHAIFGENPFWPATVALPIPNPKPAPPHCATE